MISSQGSELFFTDGTTLYKIGCPLSISPLSDPIAGVDQTPLGAAASTSAPGKITTGTFACTVNYDGGDATQKALLDAYENRTTLEWAVLLSESTTQPTLSFGSIAVPTDRTAFEFEGWLSDRPLTVALDKLVTMQISVQRTTIATMSTPV